MKIIPIKNGWFALIDDEDLQVVQDYSWCAIESDGSVYLHARERGTDKKVMMHRVIMGKPPGEVDHVNGTHVGNYIDNQRSNLRLATRSLNLRNRGPQRNSLSGISGVRFRKDKSKWVAVVYPNSIRLQIGSFNTKEEAAVAVCEWKKRNRYLETQFVNLPPKAVTLCGFCGARFGVHLPHHKFCSPKCRKRSHSAGTSLNHAKQLGL